MQAEESILYKSREYVDGMAHDSGRVKWHNRRTRIPIVDSWDKHPPGQLSIPRMDLQ